MFLDVTQRKLAEEAHELIAGEMSHRVKNLLAVASALTQITSRAATTQEMAQDLTNRLITLGRVHDLVRPLPGQEKREVLIADLLTILLSPYEGVGDSRRIRVAAPKINIGEASSTTLALVIHELATNSAKYGALSVISGLLDVSCAEDDGELVIVSDRTWRSTRFHSRQTSGLRQQDGCPQHSQSARWFDYDELGEGGRHRYLAHQQEPLGVVTGSI